MLFAATASLPSFGFTQGKDSPSAVNSSVGSILQVHEIVVVVAKQARTLTLYRRGKVVGTYPVVLGARPIGAKRYEGDLRTPEGIYAVSDKRSHERWEYFIEFNYPNEADRRAYTEAAADGTIPLFDQRMPGPGGAVGIHGSDRPADQMSGRDWTKGCVAMRNEDVSAIYAVVDVGTPVIVLP